MSLGGHFRAIKLNIKTKPVMQAALSVTPKTQKNSFPSKLILLLYTSPIMSVMSKINNETSRDNNGKHIYHFDNKYYILRKKSFEGPGLWYCESERGRSMADCREFMRELCGTTVINGLEYHEGSNKRIRHNFTSISRDADCHGLRSVLEVKDLSEFRKSVSCFSDYKSQLYSSVCRSCDLCIKMCNFTCYYSYYSCTTEKLKVTHQLIKTFVN